MNVFVTSEVHHRFEPDDSGAELAGEDGANERTVSRELAVEIRVSDERANIPVSEVTERFLRAIIAKVPINRIEELHLFSPLRQGSVETGIAVVAARVVVVDAPVANENKIVAAYIAETSPAAANADELIASEVAADMVQLVDAENDDHGETEVDDNFVLACDPPQPPRIRHTVYTARYRLVIKGSERGQWEMDVVDEADAPLLTVETVVRGVQRRAGEDTATVRYDALQLARVLHLTPPTRL